MFKCIHLSMFTYIDRLERVYECIHSSTHVHLGGSVDAERCVVHILWKLVFTVLRYFECNPLKPSYSSGRPVRTSDT